MKAIELLMSEHRTIEKTLDAMEAWVEHVRCQAQPSERDELRRFVCFLRDFVDTHHHGKEEGILFATMLEHGALQEQGPIALMLHEHDLGRSLVDTLASLSEQRTLWNEDDRRNLEQTVQAYAKLLREHIQKEDRILYPLAERRLPRPVKQELAKRFLATLLFDNLALPIEVTSVREWEVPG